MKKSLVLLLSLLLLVALAIPVSAAKGNAVTTASKTFLGKGDVFTLTVSVTESYECASFGIDFLQNGKFVWDENVFEPVLTSGRDVSYRFHVGNSLIEDCNLSAGCAAWASTTKQSLSGDLFSIDMRVKDSAPAGTYSIAMGVVLDGGDTVAQKIGATVEVADHVCTYLDDTDLDCNVCGKLRYLSYEIKDGKVIITDCDENVTIPLAFPGIIEGLPVTEIGEGAFENTQVTAVHLPATIEKIGDYAFWGCNSLSEFSMPSTVTEIGKGAFHMCFSLWQLDLSQNLVSIGDGAFSGCHNLNQINLPGSLQTIGKGAFAECYGLQSITIPSSVSVVEETLFWMCENLHNVAIPLSVTAIEQNAFTGVLDVTIWYEGSVEDRNRMTEDSAVGEGIVWNYDSCMANSGPEKTHAYYSPCDTACALCGKTRVAPHVFRAACGTFCLSCGFVREAQAEHVYVSACDHSCEMCFEERMPPHEYDNDCDSSCNGCGITRPVPDHVYDNDADQDCNVCGAPRYTVGDLNDDNAVSSHDVIHLLYASLFGEERYPLNQPCDFDRDGALTSQDAVYLLYHLLFGDRRYPLTLPKSVF